MIFARASFRAATLTATVALSVPTAHAFSTSSRDSWWWSKSKTPQPDNNGSPSQPSQNRIYVPVRYEQEFDSLALLPTPLLANFTLRGDAASDQITGALIKIVSYETEKSISAVDIETDELTTRPLMERYGVSNILHLLNC